MSEDLAKSMAKARNLWHDGKFKESAQAIKSISTLDAPSQVRPAAAPQFLVAFATYVACSSMCCAAQAQHNKLLADFSAQNQKDPQKLLLALEALDQVCSEAYIHTHCRALTLLCFAEAKLRAKLRDK